MLDEVQGFGFPFQIDPRTGGVAWSRGRDKIRQNVRIILETRQGERPMLRDFGSRIPSLVHDINDDVLADIARRQAQEALLQWEPRVLITDLATQQDEGEVQLRIRYVHPSNTLRDEVVLML
jgi:phage baseplate assembly protein W